MAAPSQVARAAELAALSKDAIILLLMARERECGEMRTALQAIVDLDDGDKPDLWHYQDDFDAARALLAAHAPKKETT